MSLNKLLAAMKYIDAIRHQLATWAGAIEVEGFLIWVLAAIAGGVISLVLRHFATLSRFVIVAGGGGSNNEYHHKSIRLKNTPGFLGLKIHRNTAYYCTARIVDPDTKHFVGGQLLWQPNYDSTKLERQHSLVSGQEATLHLFGRYKDEDSVFIYDSPMLSATEKPVPSGNARFRPPQKLWLHIEDGNGYVQRFKNRSIEKEKFTDQIYCRVGNSQSSM